MRRAVLILTVIFALLTVGVPASGALRGPGQEGYALAKGTVFTNQGFSLGGAEVEVRRIDIEEERRDDTRQRALSNRQGEFAFRLPPGPSRWEVTVRADHFKVNRREFEIFAEERVDFTILLEPEGR